MGRGRGKKKYASLWCMRTKKHFVVPLTTIKNIKHREIGKIFNYNKVETKLIDIGEDEKALQQKAINEENISSAVEQAKQRCEEQKIPDEDDNEHEKSAVINSNKRKIDEMIGLDKNIFDNGKRLKLVPTANHLPTNEDITVKNLDNLSTSDTSNIKMIQQQQHSGLALIEKTQTIDVNNQPPTIQSALDHSRVTLQQQQHSGLALIEKTPTIDVNNQPPTTIKSPLDNSRVTLQQQQHPASAFIEKTSQTIIKSNTLPMQNAINSALQKPLQNNINSHSYEKYGSPVPPPSATPVCSGEQSFSTSPFNPVSDDGESYILTDLDTKKATPKIVSNVSLSEKHSKIKCMYTSPTVTPQCSRAYGTDSLGLHFNNSADYHKVNKVAVMSEVGNGHLPENIFNGPQGNLSHQSTSRDGSAGLEINKKPIFTTTRIQNLPTNNIDSVPSTSYQHGLDNRDEPIESTLPHSQLADLSSAVELDSSDDIEGNENLPETMELVAMMPRGQITARDVWMQKQIYLSFKRAYELQQQLSKIVDNGFKVPETFLKEGDDKVEIHRDCGFFLPKNVKTLIDFKYEEEKSWDVIVKETILHVYGDNIINFSATGKGSTSRPKIHPKLLTGLLGWINQGRVAGELIKKKDLVTEINHISSNKRGYQTKKQVKKSTDPK